MFAENGRRPFPAAARRIVLQGTFSAKWTNCSGKQHFQKRPRHGAANASMNEKEASLLANIIIVGANQGIGYYIAERLLAQGHSVAILDTSLDQAKALQAS